MLPSPAELAYFVEVSNTLNISRAAERVGISQPTLTLAIKRLEESVGVALLIRSKSGVQLTQAGHQLAAQARSLISEWEKIRGDVLKNEIEVRGRYTLGCHASVGLYALPGFLEKLMTTHEGLEVKLVHDISRRITEEVISFKIDFGLVVNAWAHPDLIIKPLCEDETGLWVSKKPGELQDPYSGKAVLICDPDLVQTQSILKQVAKQGMVFKRIIDTSNLELVTALVAAQAGVGVIPGRVARRLPALGLKPLGKDTPRYSDKIALIFRADAQRSKASREIAHFIEENFIAH